MLFNSLEFAVFFPVVVAIYFFAVPLRWRWAWLLLASCYFYMVLIPEYILILALTIVVDYVAGLQIERRRGRARRVWLWSSIVVTCAILFFFKYLDFAWQVGHDIREWWGEPMDAEARTKFGWLLPIGLSFHTFQSLSYVIEVYWGRQKAERHFGLYAVYVLFFPQLVAGPIERPQNLLGQFRRKQDFVPERVSSGLRLMLWGMLQKTVVADRLGMAVDHVYSDAAKAAPEAALLASVFFAIQILADFQGYTNMARGAARVLGFELIRNFAQPYAALSITEFWRRWHMSLSSWFRDYVYIPLGGRRVGATRNVVNLIVTFTLSGLWHGANWTFMIWGGLNGVFVALEKAFKVRGDLFKPVRRLYTICAILVGWVFFRAASVPEACMILSKFPAGMWHLLKGGSPDLANLLGVSMSDVVFALAAWVAMESVDLTKVCGQDWGEWLRRRWNAQGRLALDAILLTLLLYSWIYFPQSSKPFIYFQF